MSPLAPKYKKKIEIETKREGRNPGGNPSRTFHVVIILGLISQQEN